MAQAFLQSTRSLLNLSIDELNTLLALGKQFSVSEILDIITTSSIEISEKVLLTSDQLYIGHEGYDYLLKKIVTFPRDYADLIEILITEFKAELEIDASLIPRYEEDYLTLLPPKVYKNLEIALAFSDLDQQQNVLLTIWERNPIIYYDLLTINVSLLNFSEYYFKQYKLQFRENNFTIIVGSTQFEVNKNILSARSVFFANYISSKPGVDFIEFDTDERWNTSETFREFISLITTGKFTEKEVHEDIIISLLTVADYFGLERMRYEDFDLYYYPFNEFILMYIMKNWKLFNTKDNRAALLEQTKQMNKTNSARKYLELRLEMFS